MLRQYENRLQTLARIDACADPIPLRKLAYRTAQVVRREGQWDFASFPYPVAGGYRGSSPKASAYLYLESGRVVGYLVVYVEQRMRDWDRAHAIIGPLWVAGAHRRRGIGRRLFTAAIADADRSGHPPAWLAPFTATGKLFAAAVDPDQRLPLCW